MEEKRIIQPIVQNFVNDKQNYSGDPVISLFQSNTHYTGHYLKYIDKFNELIKTDKKLNKIYKLIISNQSINNIYKRLMMILAGIKLFDENSPVYRNSSQIYNHELYWKSITNQTDSTRQLTKCKNKLFNSNEDLNNFYKKFVDLGVKEFGSGWLWICVKTDTNKLDVFTTHDSKVPFDNSNMKILAVVDLWEHAFYLDYPANKKKYLEESFKILNWKYIMS